MIKSVPDPQKLPPPNPPPPQKKKKRKRKEEKRQNKKINRRSFDVAVERVSHKHHNG
jgi:hypothetical protein